MNKKKVTMMAAAMVMLMSVSVNAATLKTTSTLNMRTGPSTGYGRVLTLPKGATVEELSTASNGWKQVKYNGKVGYVSNKYVATVVNSDVPLPTTSSVTSSTVKSNASLNVRSTSSTSGKVVVVMPKNAVAEYIGTAPNGWFNVKYKGKVGFVSNRYSTLLNAAPSTPAPAPAPAPTPAPVEPAPVEPAPVVDNTQLSQVTMYYTTSNLNMRSGVGTNNAVLVNIPKGAHLQSLGTSGGWHQVSYAGKTGWVSGSYLGKGTVWMKNGVIVANKGYAMSSSFNPGENPEARANLNQFIAAGKSAGHNMKVFSGFRTYNYQRDLYNRYANKDGVAKADTYSARPGHSEHQTGLAFDVGAAGYTTSTALGQHASGKWMAANAHKYGFVLSYPEGKTETTGYQYEPWHFRYVGVDTATKVYQSGQTLDEYLGTVSPSYK